MDLATLEITDILTDFPRQPLQFAIDPVGGNFYWTTAGHTDIWRASLDGTNQQPIATMAEVGGGSTDIDVEPHQQKLYWMRSRPESTGPTTFSRANLDGTSTETLFLDSTCCVFSVAIAPSIGTIFWAKDKPGNETVKTIQRASITTGGLRQTIAVGRRYSGISVDEDAGKVYWITNDFLDRRIQRANFDGTELEDIVTQDKMPAGFELIIDGGRMSHFARCRGLC